MHPYAFDGPGNPLGLVIVGRLGEPAEQVVENLRARLPHRGLRRFGSRLQFGRARIARARRGGELTRLAVRTVRAEHTDARRNWESRHGGRLQHVVVGAQPDGRWSSALASLGGTPESKRRSGDRQNENCGNWQGAHYGNLRRGDRRVKGGPIKTTCGLSCS